MNRYAILPIFTLIFSDILGMIGKFSETCNDVTNKTNMKMYSVKQIEQEMSEINRPHLEKNRKSSHAIFSDEKPTSSIKIHSDITDKTDITSFNLEKKLINNETACSIEKNLSIHPIKLQNIQYVDATEKSCEKRLLQKKDQTPINKSRKKNTYHVRFSGEEYARYNAKEAALEAKQIREEVEKKKRQDHELKETKNLLEKKGIPPDQITKNEENLMVNAVKESNLDLAKLLLQHGANPNQLGSLLLPSRKTPAKIHVSLLSLALLNEDINMMKLLLKQGIHPDNCSILSCSLFFIAYALNKLDIAELLLKYGANPNQKGWLGNYSFIVDAVHEENIDMVRLLLKYGADPNQIDIFEETPTLIATKAKNIDLVKLLIHYGGRFYLHNEI